MTGHTCWLELTAAGMDFAALAMGGWYVGAKYGQRVRQQADAQPRWRGQPRS